MDKKIDKYNEDLVEFWNSSIFISEEDRKEFASYKEEDYIYLSPSEKLTNAVFFLKDCKHILDYGCGNAWMSIIASKCGAKNVLAVDIIPNGIETAKAYANAFKCDGLKIELVDTNWIKNTKEEFDGVICNNVIDVLPLETSIEIIKDLARITSKDGHVIIGMNYYISPEAAASRNMVLVEEKYLFVNGILRLLSLSDDQWKEIFSPYFEIEKLEYFAWPNEKKETRRLFFLKKK